MGRTVASLFAATAVAALSLLGRQSPTAAAPYPAMAPLASYLMPSRAAEIALARSAAPKSISDGAEVMVLENTGYTVAAPGGNGFVCLVERSWESPDDPQFWDPKLRGPICLNPPAVRTYLPISLLRTRLALAGKSKADIFRGVAAAFANHQLPAIEPGALGYMLSKQQFLDDTAHNWHPHLMFFLPRAPAAQWGADLPGSPVLSGDNPENHNIILMIPVSHWSDGTPDTHQP